MAWEWQRIFGVTMTVGLGFGAVFGCVHRPQGSVPVHDVRTGGYQFISPLLECEGELWQNAFMKPFDRKLETLVEKIIKEGRAEHVSVYFRDLNNGPWVGINESEKFAPASLLKVPVMMVWLKMAESDPETLNHEVQVKTIQPELYETVHFKAPEVIEAGRAYRVEDLIRRMIVHSDNNAMILLSKFGNRRIADDLYDALEVPPPGGSQAKEFMTIRQYASFFRILFNATYLNREMSEKALKFLSESGFEKGLVAGVPPGVPVAHKFGERQRKSLDTKQLHDVGIIYYPKRPYLLAVMTRGQDYYRLADVIRDISRFVYEEVDRQVTSSWR